MTLWMIGRHPDFHRWPDPIQFTGRKFTGAAVGKICVHLEKCEFRPVAIAGAGESGSVYPHHRKWNALRPRRDRQFIGPLFSPARMVT